MKIITLLSLLLLFSCGTKKNQSNQDIKTMTASVEIIVNKMPTTDTGSKNYAIVTLDNGGDTLSADWRVSQFVLLNDKKEVLQSLSMEQLSMDLTGKGKTQMKYNVRNLLSSIPSSVIVELTMDSADGAKFETTTDPIQPTVVQ
jgi:hypothetical protein